MKISFIPDGIAMSAAPGTSLLNAAEVSGVLLDASCGGGGLCGKCKVQIVSGDAGTATPEEIQMLSMQELADGYRLACKTYAFSDLTVRIPAFHSSAGRKKTMVKLPDDLAPDRRIRVEQGVVPKATMANQHSDMERLRDCFHLERMQIPAPLLPEIRAALKKNGGAVTAVFQGDTLLALHPKGQEASGCYAVAFDVGTTTVVGMLWDMRVGSLVGVEAETNYQSIFGSDVISRIQFCMESADGLGILQKKIMDCVNSILSKLCAQSGVDPEHIYAAAVVGNTTMSHLFWGVDPQGMSRTPFAPVFTAAQRARASDLGLHICHYAEVLMLPNIAGHVGSDIVGMMLAARIDSRSGCHIAIDIGTNGEIVAVKDGRLVTCSTAAGPAFEGARIRQGMRAAPGAIEAVRIQNGVVQLDVIDAVKPVGICGSGLIDAVAELLECGIITPSGKVIEPTQAEEFGISPELVKRIIKTNEGASFILAYGDGQDDIALSQQDIREVQLGKGAILAGIYTLMDTLAVEAGEIDSILLAGAFGNYIRKESAVRIGLLPQISPDRIHPIGNAAGIGACMALLSDAECGRADRIAQQTQHIELSMNATFQDYFISAMSFGAESMIAL